MDKYNILLFLNQSNPIGEEHSDRIYSSVSEFKNDKDIMLILGSHGGQIEPAYLISKNCKSKSQNKFIVVYSTKSQISSNIAFFGG
ncbi:MAG: hypothetical protein LBD30_00940 [Verrucomicrobiales bacterium]|jgi:hypothetical protein|nr:hypothetical protein [Verrucomicrobiales bacterium]